LTVESAQSRSPAIWIAHKFTVQHSIVTAASTPTTKSVTTGIIQRLCSSAYGALQHVYDMIPKILFCASN